MPQPAFIAKYLDRHPVLRLIGGTPMVPLEPLGPEQGGSTILAKIESRNPGGSLKDRPVMRMLLEAIERGALTKEKIILDSSSGNAGIAYAMIGSALGYRVELVVPGNASEERKKRLRAHGALVHYTDPVLGYDEALREVHRLHEGDPARYFFSDQYSNEGNWRAHYETTAEEILSQTEGRLTHFVAGVGTGGSITGIGRRLKEHDPKIQVVCILPDPFPGIEGLKPLGRPGDIVPGILDESVIDKRIAVSADSAYRMCQALARQGIFAGQSSGGYAAACLEVARAERDAVIVTLVNDIGDRYFSTGLWD